MWLGSEGTVKDMGEELELLMLNKPGISLPGINVLNTPHSWSPYGCNDRKDLRIRGVVDMFWYN